MLNSNCSANSSVATLLLRSLRSLISRYALLFAGGKPPEAPQGANKLAHAWLRQVCIEWGLKPLFYSLLTSQARSRSE